MKPLPGVRTRAGIEVAAGYPGTPSSEILENVARYKQIYSEWSVNEKVAMDTAASVPSSRRSLVTAKQVGMNVLSDSLFYTAYTGLEAGLVVVTADDPGMFSSQNEQDNRHYAKLGKFPLLEPADSQECKDFVIKGVEISESFDTPVLIRTTMRTSHSKSVVTLGRRPRILSVTSGLLPATCRNTTVCVYGPNSGIPCWSSGWWIWRNSPKPFPGTVLNGETGTSASLPAVWSMNMPGRYFRMHRFELGHDLSPAQANDSGVCRGRRKAGGHRRTRSGPGRADTRHGYRCYREGCCFLPCLELLPDDIKRYSAEAGLLPVEEKLRIGSYFKDIPIRTPALCPGCPIVPPSIF